MLRRYELTDEEWNRIAPLLPPENSGKQGRPQKCSRTILNGIVWIARSGAPWRDLPERYGSWQTVYSRFRKWIEDGTLDNIFRVLSLEAELTELSIDDSIVKAHQHSAGAKKRGDSKRNRTQPCWSHAKHLHSSIIISNIRFLSMHCRYFLCPIGFLAYFSPLFAIEFRQFCNTKIFRG